MSITRGRLISVLAIGLLVTVFHLAVLPGVAFAATSYTNPLPAPNSVTALKTPAVKLTVTDPQGVNTSSLIMKLDNLSVRGKWSGSTVTYQPTTAIANGTHTASVSVLNSAGAIHLHVELHREGGAGRGHDGAGGRLDGLDDLPRDLGGRYPQWGCTRVVVDDGGRQERLGDAGVRRPRRSRTRLPSRFATTPSTPSR